MSKGAHSKVALFLTNAIDASPKSQSEIAAEAGFPKSNIISMIKMGLTKLPLTRIPALAKSIDVDPAELYRMCMEEYMPDLLKVTDFVYDREKLNRGEADLIKRLRLHTGGKSFRMDTDRYAAIDDFAKSLGR
jgi:hypothetical protein